MKSLKREIKTIIIICVFSMLIYQQMRINDLQEQIDLNAESIIIINETIQIMAKF